MIVRYQTVEVADRGKLGLDEGEEAPLASNGACPMGKAQLKSQNYREAV
jgi:hypothetical protein